MAKTDRTARTADAPQDEFEADLHRPEDPLPGHAGESRPAREDKDLHERLDGLDPYELDRLTVLEPGTRLQQGSTYLDLDALERGPFTAMGGQEVPPDHRYVAKRETDHDLWNRLLELAGARS
jgi:hypothetical protein